MSNTRIATHGICIECKQFADYVEPGVHYCETCAEKLGYKPLTSDDYYKIIYNISDQQKAE